MTNCEMFHDTIGELLHGIDCYTNHIDLLEEHDFFALEKMAESLKDMCSAYEDYTKGKAYEHHMMSPEMHMPETHTKA